MTVAPRNVSTFSGSDAFQQLNAAVERLLAMATAAGETRLAEDARALAARSAEGRFYVACVGQFKRGKSTLLDALLGEAILPIGITPVTAVPTLIRFGHERCARVRTAGADWRIIPLEAIPDFVSEGSNPGNRLNVEGIEAVVPAPILRDGLCLVDTPGLGSVYEWNSESTRQLIPEIDVGLVVTGANPPITGEELKLVESLLERTSRLVIVMNKADLSSAPEIAEAAAFARKVISERTGYEVGEVFVTNAKAHLAGTAFEDDWQRLRAHLESVARSSRAELVRTGISHGVRRLASRLAWAVDDETRMLRSPIEEAKIHIEQLDALSLDLKRSIGDLRQLLVGEQWGILRVVEDDARRFVDAALIEANESLMGAAAAISASGGSLRRKLTRVAQGIAEHHLTSWLESERPRIEELYAQCMQRFVDSAHRFLNRLAPSGETFSESAGLITVAPSLPSKSGYYYGRFESIAMDASPVRVVADVLSGAFGARRGIVRDAERYLTRLLESNASRIQYDLRERLDQARRGFESDLTILLGEMLTSAKRTLRRVRETHSSGVAAVEGRLAELARQKEELIRIHDAATVARHPVAADPLAGNAK